MKQLFLSQVFLIFAVQIAAAQIPRTISYQGFIHQGNIPAADGNHTIVFSLYDALTGGNLLYQETEQAQTIKGNYSFVIGLIAPIPASMTFDSQYYCGIAVDGNPEEIPRTAFSSSPYALRADFASGLSPNAKIPNTLVKLSSTPGGTAGGDLRGFYPGPTVTGFQSQPVTADTPYSGDHLRWDGKSWRLYSTYKSVAFIAAGDTTMIITDSTSGKIHLVADSTNGTPSDSNYINLSSGIFTAPAKGVYGFSAKFSISAKPDPRLPSYNQDTLQYYLIGIVKGDSIITSQKYFNIVAKDTSFFLDYDTITPLHEGDNINLFIMRQRDPAFQNSNRPFGTYIVRSTQFVGYKIN